MRHLTKAEERWGSPLPPLAGGDPALTEPSNETEPETDERSLLQKMLDRRAELAGEVDPLIEEREKEHAEFEAREAAEKDEDKPTDEERTVFIEAEEAFNKRVQANLKEIKSLDFRIERQELVEHGRELATRASEREASTSVVITHEPEVYGRHREAKGASYYLDLAAKMRPDLRSELGSKIDGFAERLEKHGKMMDELLPKREQQRKRVAERQIERAEMETRGRLGIQRRGLDVSPFEKRAPSREPGQGGYAVPPLWLISDYLEFLRPGRVAAGLCRQMPLPPGTDSINIPKLTTPTAVAIQTADNAPVVSQDIKDNYVNAAVKTIAGFADIPVQLLEQSPGTIIDQVITRDMMAAYDVALDKQVILGKGVGAPLSGGEIKGIYPNTNWEANTVTWTAASPKAQGFFQVLGAMASKTAQTRFNLKDFTFLVHPRRGFWAFTAVDTVGRFLVGQDDGGFSNFNADAIYGSEDAPFEGYLGKVPFGPKLYIDANMPTTDASGVPGAGAADIGIGAIWDDLWLMEGDIRTDVFDQTLSGTLEIRFRLYNYVALLQRYGPSVTIASGTGFAAPETEDKTPY
jgi:HK97 family phage major capsid protein